MSHSPRTCKLVAPACDLDPGRDAPTRDVPIPVDGCPHRAFGDRAPADRDLDDAHGPRVGDQVDAVGPALLEVEAVDPQAAHALVGLDLEARLDLPARQLHPVVGAQGRQHDPAHRALVPREEGVEGEWEREAQHDGEQSAGALRMREEIVHGGQNWK